jgi:putative DNA primase/helicase
LKLIIEGVPDNQDRSAQFHHAVGWLKQLGWSEEAVLALLKQHPKGIASKYVKSNRLDREVKRCFGKTSDPEPGPSTPPPDDGEAPVFSDEYLAIHFANKHAHELRHVAKWSRWMVYDGVRWQFDEKLKVFTYARKLCRAVAKTANDPKVRKQIASAKTVGAAVSLARSDQRIAATVDQWDTDPWLLNTPGGVVDLRTGKMREHRPDDYMTKCTAVTPHGDCPRFKQFFAEVTGNDREMMEYMQRVDGYSLTGLTKEHSFFFYYGTGRNGKGVKLNTTGGILADYHQAAPLETFVSQQSRHETELAMLMGARVVTVGETEAGKRWTESKIKTLTGGDPISARFMRQDFFTYTPTYKLHISGNHRPGLNSVNVAIASRVKLLPFEITIPEEKRDQDLTEKLKAEWPGILAWMIEGCVEWQRVGLNTPAKVREAVQAYINDEDKLGLWISECVDTTKPNEYSSSTDLFASWKEWADENGEYIGSMTKLVNALQDHGYRRGRSTKGDSNGFYGMTVRGFNERI